MAHILIIDDDEMICEVLSRRVTNSGHTAETALNLKDGLRIASSEYFDVVFLDINLPDGDGLEHLPMILETASRPEIIIITGKGDPDGAELAIRSGAWDYVQKPFSREKISLQLKRALQYREGVNRQQAPVALKRDGIIGSSSQMNACLDLVAQAAHSNVNVLITGETGTGKELLARAIYLNSLRNKNAFVVVDCTVLPEKLVESVLFGHEKGSFTGADKPYEGLIKQADGGTLFLDEVGELPLSMQKAFLRVLQEHRFRSVGGRQEESSDFRLIAATNRDLEEMAKSGQFRRDLLFRLRAFTVESPPLREHIEDIREITLYYTARFCERNGVETKGLSPEFIEMLENYRWPGNVRELVNILERAITMEPLNPVLYPKHLPDHVRAEVVRASVTKEAPFTGTPKETSQRPRELPKLKDLRERMIADLEHQYLKDLMALTNGNIKEACRTSGLGRARLYELMKKYRISKHIEM